MITDNNFGNLCMKKGGSFQKERFSFFSVVNGEAFDPRTPPPPPPVRTPLKLEHYGIRGIALKLLKSILTNRSQFVADQNLRTNDEVNRFGVPQGSNLGPLLFLIYINDIPDALFSKPRLFADDTCLVIQEPTHRYWRIA